MKNLKIYCVTNKTVNFLDNTNYNIGWVGKEIPPKNYILCNAEDYFEYIISNIGLFKNYIS